MRAPFIVLEGIDGSGTTTLGRYLTFYLSTTLGREALFTAEPSSGPVGKLLRRYLKKEENLTHFPFGRLSLPHFMSLLFAADRVDHCASVIGPAVDADKIVVCDRYHLSTFAYQWDGTNDDLLLALNENVVEPDLTIFLRVSPQIAAYRRNGRLEQPPELYEVDDFQKMVAKNYDHWAHKLQRLGASPIVAIDADQDIMAVQEQVVTVVENLLNGR